MSAIKADIHLERGLMSTDKQGLEIRLYIRAGDDIDSSSNSSVAVPIVQRPACLVNGDHGGRAGRVDYDRRAAESERIRNLATQKCLKCS